MKAFGLVVLFLLVLTGGLVWHLPMKVLTDAAGLEAQGIRLSGVQGSWRQGQASMLSVGAYRLGQVETRWKPARLPDGEAAFDVRLSGPGLSARAELARSVTGAAMALREGSVRLDVAGFPGLADRVRAVGGSVALSGADIAMDGGRCVRAAGRVETDVLARAQDVYGWTGPVLTGDITCENGQIVMPLAGQTPGGDRFTAEARLGGAGLQSAFARVETADPQLIQILTFTGFQAEDGAWVYRPALIQTGKTP